MKIIQNPILQFFKYDHLPPAMQAVSKPFCELAHQVASSGSLMQENPEREVALRKLLEAKDAAVRAAIFKEVVLVDTNAIAPTTPAAS